MAGVAKTTVLLASLVWQPPTPTMVQIQYNDAGFPETNLVADRPLLNDVPMGHTTVGEVCDELLSRLNRQKRLSRFTVATRRCYLKQLRDELGGTDLADLSVEVMQDWVDAPLPDAPGKARNRHIVLGVICRAAGATLRDRYALVRKVRVNRRTSYLEAEDFARLRHAIIERRKRSRTGPAEHAALNLIETLCVIPLRKREGISVEYAHIQRSHLEVPRGKTGPRTVPLSQSQRRLLLSYPRFGRFVFSRSDTGKVVGATTVDRTFRFLREQAELPDGIVLHSLRHSWASTAINAGLSLEFIGKCLGHSHTTMSAMYAHVSDKSVRDANAAVADMIASMMEGDGPG